MDDIDDLLRPKLLPPEAGRLRETLIRDATRILGRRRWLIRGRRLGIPVACFLAGLASMWIWSSDRASRPIVVSEEPQSPEALPAPVDPYRNDPPERLEKWAFIQTGQKRAELYRRAGDGYLGREDVEAALRCYRRSLDGGSAADLAIRADRDTWLFMSLKMARQKEKPDARIN